jgi:hypothetical protein
MYIFGLLPDEVHHALNVLHFLAHFPETLVTLLDTLAHAIAVRFALGRVVHQCTLVQRRTARQTEDAQMARQQLRDVEHVRLTMTVGNSEHTREGSNKQKHRMSTRCKQNRKKTHTHSMQSTAVLSDPS